MAVDQSLINHLNRPALSRLWREVKKKYESLGRVGGRVRLSELTPVEQEAVSGLLKTNLTSGSVSISLETLDRALQQSRFGHGLEDFLKATYGSSLRTRQERSDYSKRRWENFFIHLHGYAVSEPVKAWLSELQSGRGSGYRSFIMLYNEDYHGALETMRVCLTVLNDLPVISSNNLRLPVFSAAVTGDPHAFDRDTPLGRLLYYGVCAVLKITPADYSAAELGDVLEKAGLKNDGISSTVVAYGLLCDPADLRAPMLFSAKENRIPLILPLRFFDREVPWLKEPAVYVVENPAVLSALLDMASGRSLPPVICVSGQPSLAAVELLDGLARREVAMYYSGDFDLAGLTIGLNLHERYKDLFRPWFFDSAAYLSAKPGSPIDEKDMRHISALEVPWDLHLPTTIVNNGYKVFQEVFVARMADKLKLASSKSDYGRLKLY
ncbi:hypothetical protein SY88_10160 [Clostridiales bacterium PH28_bin88]|nr:hypothetical protein SY88_10160 [Clostridiales bacterium PH28_bin88]